MGHVEMRANEVENGSIVKKKIIYCSADKDEGLNSEFYLTSSFISNSEFFHASRCTDKDEVKKNQNLKLI